MGRGFTSKKYCKKELTRHIEIHIRFIENSGYDPNWPEKFFIGNG